MGLSTALAPANKSDFAVTREQATRVLAAFDLSGDGALQLGEWRMSHDLEKEADAGTDR